MGLKLPKIKIPKTITGLLITLAGGVAATVPILQAASPALIKLGIATTSVGLAAKAVRAAGAPKGEKLKAVTKHEWELIQKARKKTGGK